MCLSHDHVCDYVCDLWLVIDSAAAAAHLLKGQEEARKTSNKHRDD